MNTNVECWKVIGCFDVVFILRVGMLPFLQEWKDVSELQNTKLWAKVLSETTRVGILHFWYFNESLSEYQVTSLLHFSQQLASIFFAIQDNTYNLFLSNYHYSIVFVIQSTFPNITSSSAWVDIFQLVARIRSFLLNSNYDFIYISANS